jgi:GNAT superfamily N-acetyltransferase
VLVWPGDGIAAGRTRVALDGPTAAGFATTVPAGDGLELEDLFVEPDRMRQGIGRTLVEDAADRARRGGVAAIRVVANGHALAFYAAAGFVEEGPARTPFGPAVRLRLDVT